MNKQTLAVEEASTNYQMVAENNRLRKGYKQTEVGVIPEDWNHTTIGNKSIKVGSGITPHGGEKVYKREGRPFIRSQNIGWGRLLLEDVAFIDEATHDSFKASEIEIDDVFLNITGASIGRSAIANVIVEKGNVNQHVCIIRTIHDQLNPSFLNYFLLSNMGQRQIDSFQAGGNRQGLNFGQIRSFRLTLPPVSEQHAIAKAISDVDALLAKLDQLITKKRDLKQAAMQQLLTGQTRLPGFSGEWEVKRLGEVFTISAGKSKSAYIIAGGRHWIVDMGSVSTDGRLIVSKPTNYSGDFLKIGDLVMPKDDIGGGGIIGKVGYIDTDETYVLGDHVYRLTANMGNPLFLSYVINGYRTNTELRKKVIGSAQLGLGRKSVNEQEVPFPSYNEQTAIAAILFDMDTEITALETRRDKTRDLKQGMMQELLTGRIRLI